jgi:hypothetical protein
VYWKELGLLFAVWGAILALEIGKVLAFSLFIFIKLPSLMSLSGDETFCFDGNRIIQQLVRWHIGR